MPPPTAYILSCCLGYAQKCDQCRQMAKLIELRWKERSPCIVAIENHKRNLFPVGRTPRSMSFRVCSTFSSISSFRFLTLLLMSASSLGSVLRNASAPLLGHVDLGWANYLCRSMLSTPRRWSSCDSEITILTPTPAGKSTDCSAMSLVYVAKRCLTLIQRWFRLLDA